MSLTFNQFQKELQKRGIEGHLAIVLTTMYEQVLEMGKQVDMCANTIASLADTVGNVVELHHVTQTRLGDLKQRMEGSVHSEELDGISLRDEPRG